VGADERTKTRVVNQPDARLGATPAQHEAPDRRSKLIRLTRKDEKIHVASRQVGKRTLPSRRRKPEEFRRILV
jgi:hypothetical protein